MKNLYIPKEKSGPNNAPSSIKTATNKHISRVNTLMYSSVKRKLDEKTRELDQIQVELETEFEISPDIFGHKF